MKVFLAREYGFCQGVRLALKKLDQVLEENPNRDVKSIGEIIHNKDVVEYYQSKGVEIVDSVFDVRDGVGVVRAHGLPLSVINDAKAQGLQVIDATCPFVRKISRIIDQELKEGFPVYIVGEPGHPEVIAATADYEGKVKIIDHSQFDASSFDFPTNKCAIVSQTTIAVKTFQEITSNFIPYCDQLHIYNTICPSTRDRQSSATELAKMVDAVVVVGGKKSSNTRRLFELCNAIKPSYHVERSVELDTEVMKSYQTVGVTAGASTPDWIVQETIHFLENC